MTTMRERLKEKSAPRYKAVLLPDGDSVTIRSLTAGDQSDIELSMYDLKTGKMDPAGLRAVKFKMVARSIVDENTHERLYGDDEWEEVRELDDAIVERLHRACVEMRDTEATAEEMLKNSE